MNKYSLIIVKTAMSGGDYTTLSHLLKKIQGEKYYSPNIFKVNADKMAMITDYLEKEKIIYEIYHEKKKYKT